MKQLFVELMKTRLRLTYWWCLFAVTAVAQHKNIEIGELPADAKRSIPTVLISRKDAKSIVVKGANNTFYLSNDVGTTWQSVNAAGMDNAEWMSLTSDSKGIVYAVYATPLDNHSRVMMAQSKDDGKTWSAPVAVSPTGGEQNYPSSSFDLKGNIYVSWTETATGADGKCESVIMLSTTGNGSKWSKPLRISQTGGNCEEGNQYLTGGVPAIGPDGKMFVSWCNNDKIYMDRSFASSLWLENDIVVNTISPGWKLDVPGYKYVASPPQLMVDQTKGSYHGCIYFSWSDQRNGKDDTDVWFMRSNNYGDNWSSPSKLGTAAAQTDQYGPRMAVDQTTGYIYVLFYDRGESEGDSTN
ncbi:MAG TPA: hypothetical protein VK658_03200, partial [Chryseolinea sp.]|nr:hypothetical protein [Chryseolinea sp.]